jgi:hypothetical protein
MSRLVSISLFSFYFYSIELIHINCVVLCHPAMFDGSVSECDTLVQISPNSYPLLQSLLPVTSSAMYVCK